MMQNFRVVLHSGQRAVLQVTCVACFEAKQLTVSTAQLRELRSPNRRNIQEVLPDMAAPERELLISGTCGVCWTRMFSGAESEELTDRIR